MDKNLFELIVYIFSLFGEYDYITSDDHLILSSDKAEIIHYNVAFYNSPLYRSFECEISSDMKFTEATEKILDSFNKRLKEE